jgi:benzoyl-CoA reductase/2-hydroxyglutaryl-CoA dehydratase subunit BcrC/BadD/HgdB
MNLGNFVQAKLQDGSAIRLLRSPWIYRFLSLFLRSQSPSVRFSFHLARDAYLKRKPVSFTSLFFPTELVYALGMIPFPLEVIAALISSMGMAVPFLKKAEEEWYSQDLCSFHRLGVGLALQDYLPQPDVVLSLTSLCDGSHRFFYNVSRLFKVPHFLIEVPGNGGKKDQEYVVRQLKRTRMELEALLERKIKKSDWEESLGYSNSLREELLKIYELQAHVPCPVSGEAALGNVGLIFTCAGSRWGPELISAWRKSIRENASSENYRLFWLHLRPYYPAPIFAFLKEKGVSIVGDELSNYIWPRLDPRNPELSLSSKIYANFGLGPIKNRIDNIVRLVRERKAQGVVSFSHRGCRQSTGGAFLLKEALKEKGIPCLILDGDCVDPRELNWEQMRTRIEGFLEIL